MHAFRYRGDPKSYPKTVGPMAQDVRKKIPGAVTPVGAGKLAIPAPVMGALATNPTIGGGARRAPLVGGGAGRPVRPAGGAPRSALAGAPRGALAPGRRGRVLAEVSRFAVAPAIFAVE
jgi:hypothetical protein